jgi:hypothetical protein
LYNKQEGKCAFSKLPMTWKEEPKHHNISIDRIDPEKGYQEDNVRLVCVWVNHSIASNGDDVFLHFVQHTYETMFNSKTQ